jgi:hypothetical protein
MTQSLLNVFSLPEVEGGCAAVAGLPGAETVAILDTHTPPNDNLELTVKRVITPRARRMFSRVHMGMMLPGTCYFITLTSSPSSPALIKSRQNPDGVLGEFFPLEPVRERRAERPACELGSLTNNQGSIIRGQQSTRIREKSSNRVAPAKQKESWENMRRWLKRHRPKSSFCYCITSEGYGVVHLVLRLHKTEKRLEIDEVREYWKKLHNAVQMKIVRVSENQKQSLAEYITDQRKKQKVGTEFIFQDKMIYWRFSKGWLPLHFTRHFGRFWFRFRAFPTLRAQLLKEWLIECHYDPSKVVKSPGLSITGEVKFYDKTLH